jgi:hypothetical protein
MFSQDHGGMKWVTGAMGGTPYEAVQDTPVGMERRPSLKEAQCALSYSTGGSSAPPVST